MTFSLVGRCEATGMVGVVLSAVDVRGGTGAFTGSRALGLFADRAGDGCVAAGNLLASGAVLDAMVEAFARGARAGVHLGSRLLDTLRAGLAAGGEVNPVTSAGMLVADRVPWPVVDLRVDFDPAPVAALGRLWEVWEPQIDDYVTRALDPLSAPPYEASADQTGAARG